MDGEAGSTMSPFLPGVHSPAQVWLSLDTTTLLILGGMLVALLLLACVLCCVCCTVKDRKVSIILRSFGMLRQPNFESRALDGQQRSFATGNVCWMVI